MKIFEKQEKQLPGFGYWGDRGEIEQGISVGELSEVGTFTDEELHYHKEGVQYFLCVEGSGSIEVEGERVSLSSEQVLRIDPGEKYRVASAKEVPFKYFAFCTIKNPEDKVLVK